jgi:hypothetical protein
MNLTDELCKLAELHQAGHLSTQEFTDAKRRLIAEGPTGQDVPGNEEKAAGEMMSEKTYKSSRWSSGNLFFPDSLTLSGDGMLFRKGALFGSREEHINYRAVASVCIKNRVFLADVSIETSGGSQPIFLNGLWKSGAKEIQDTIRASQRGAVQRKP